MARRTRCGAISVAMVVIAAAASLDLLQHRSHENAVMVEALAPISVRSMMRSTRSMPRSQPLFLSSEDPGATTETTTEPTTTSGKNETMSPVARRALVHEKQKMEFIIEDLKSADARIAAITTDDQLRLEEKRLLNYQKLVQRDVAEAGQARIVVNMEPPEGMSEEEFQQAMAVFVKLPSIAQRSMVEALLSLGEKEDTSKVGEYRLCMLLQIPQLMRRFHDNRIQLTEQRLQDSIKAIKRADRGLVTITMADGKTISDLVFSTTAKTINATRSPPNKTESSLDNVELQIDKFFADVLDKSPEQARAESNLNSKLARNVRKEGVRPSARDLEIVMAALDQGNSSSRMFSTSGTPEEALCGYIIRGNIVNKDFTDKPDDFMAALNDKLPAVESWNGTLAYMNDPTMPRVDDGPFDSERVLVLLHKDFSPASNPIFSQISTVCAIVTTSLFCIGVYGSNDAVFDKLNEYASLGDFSGFDWFNGKIAQILVPLLSILASHELGHQLVAKRDQFKVSSVFPTLLPFLNSLPLLGAYTKIISSPKNRSSLFDFAIAGPVLGMAASAAFLLTGLSMTTEIMASGDASAIQLLPALPTSVIQLSTLGTTIVDTFLNGNDVLAAIANQNTKSPVPLHPFAIAGYCGMLINAVALMPLGSSDGGRMSQALFGRGAHNIIAGTFWILLLVCNFTLTGTQGDLLLSAWIVYNVVENDTEVPAQQEIEGVDIGRAAAALGSWFLAALVLVPVVTQS